MACLCLNLLVTCLFLHALSAVAQHGEVEDQSTFTYSVNHTTGPHNWGKLNPNWTACGIGQFQSPIDLVNQRVVALPALGNLIRVHKPALAEVKNRGHDIEVKFHGDAGGVIINGTLYSLTQCHWHTPSEHTVDGRKYPMEMHMVHQDARGQLAVVGLLYNVGRRDPFLATLLRSNRTVNQNGTAGHNATSMRVIDPFRPGNQTVNQNGTASHNVTSMRVIDPLRVKFQSRQYLRYVGSLTTPPCTEGVLWTVLRQESTVSVRQLKALRAAVHDGFENNARPIQHYKKPVFLFQEDSTAP